MFERNIRNTLPCLSKNLKHNCMNRETLESKDRKAKQRQKTNYDKHHGVINLPELQPGDLVLVKTDDEKHWKTQARVLQKVAPRSYVVRTDSKGDLRRNRRHLKKIPENNYRDMDQHDNLDLEPDQESPPASPAGLWTSSVAGTPLSVSAREKDFFSRSPIPTTPQPRRVVTPRRGTTQLPSPDPSPTAQLISKTSTATPEPAQQIQLRRSTRRAKPPRRLISE